MAALVSDVRAAIVAAVTAKGVLAFAYARDDVVVPEFQVGPPEVIEYDTTYGRGVDRHLIPCRFYAAKADEETGWDTLDEYVGATGTNSLKLAIEDLTVAEWVALDPVAVRVMTAEGYGEYRLGGAAYLGVEFQVEVYV